MKTTETLNREIEEARALLAKLEQEKEEIGNRRILFEKGQVGDYAIADDNVFRLANNPRNNWINQCDVWPTRELGQREIEWRKARAVLIREISRINEGVEIQAGERYYYCTIAGDEAFLMKAPQNSLNCEPFLRIRRQLTDPEYDMLAPHYRTYYGVID